MIYVWSFSLPKLLHWIYKPSASESTNQYYTELFDFSRDTDQLFKSLQKVKYSFLGLLN
jgi:IS1 family transposase